MAGDGCLGAHQNWTRCGRGAEAGARKLAAAPKLFRSAPHGPREGGSHLRPATVPQATNLTPRRDTRTRPGAGRWPPYAAASAAANELAGFDAPRMMIEALFAAACNAFDDKWL